MAAIDLKMCIFGSYIPIRAKYYILKMDRQTFHFLHKYLVSFNPLTILGVRVLALFPLFYQLENQCSKKLTQHGHLVDIHSSTQT